MKSASKIPASRAASGTLLALCLMTVSGVWYEDLFGATLGSLIADVRNNRANTSEAGKATQKYYEDLITDEDETAGGVADAIAAPEERQRGGPRDVIQKSGATRDTDDFLPWELIPNTSIIFKGVPLEVNAFGHRDGTDYTQAKPEGTFRIALAGGSNTMGSGVPVELTFAHLLEERLNDELAGGAFRRYEVINFSVGGYHLPERLFVVQNKVAAFDPDLILVGATDRDLTIQHERLARKFARGNKEPIDLAFLKKIIRQAGVKRRDELDRMVRKLQPFQEDILLGCLEELARYSRDHDVALAVFLLRREGGHSLGKDLQATYQILKRGEVTILPLFESYEGVGEMELWLQPHPNPDLGDPHPNKEGHRRIADDLYNQLMADATIRALLRGD